MTQETYSRATKMVLEIEALESIIKELKSYSYSPTFQITGPWSSVVVNYNLIETHEIKLAILIRLESKLSDEKAKLEAL